MWIFTMVPRDVFMTVDCLDDSVHSVNQQSSSAVSPQFNPTHLSLVSSVDCINDPNPLQQINMVQVQALIVTALVVSTASFTPMQTARSVSI